MTGQAKAGLVLGVLAGLVVGAGSGVAGRLVQRLAVERPKRAWDVIPIPVTTRALPAGHVLTMDDVSLRSVPEPQATPSLVKAQDTSYVVNQALQAPLAEGQPLEWSFFDGATPPQREPIARAACEGALTARLGAAPVETLADIEARLARGAR